ncbi:MAG TPA: GNAT family N-acetyltransferase [Streptomyces sp.]|nr:GNAT family N-acetyltransferase [Streptomyces sp.]
MSAVRRAGPDDAREVLRLRQVMIDSMAGAPSSTRWQGRSLPGLRARLAGGEGDFAAFVVDHPDRPGALAALVVGTPEYRIGRPGDPDGTVGHVFGVATDPAARRRGHARARMTALLVWFRERGAGHVALASSAEAEPLYAALGFVRDSHPSMRLYL